MTGDQSHCDSCRSCRSSLKVTRSKSSRESQTSRAISSGVPLYLRLCWGPTRCCRCVRPISIFAELTFTQLGPDAANLAGTKLGPERVVHRLGLHGDGCEQCEGDFGSLDNDVVL